MSILVVGAGAVGGYLGAQLLAAQRNVTFLVHPGRWARLNAEGLRIRRGNGVEAIPVDAVTVSELRGHYDLVVLAVRSNAVPSAIDDIAGVITSGTRIIPVVNGVRHLWLLTAAFGQELVFAAEAKLATSMLSDNTIEEVVPGIQFELGQIDGGRSPALSHTVTELDVANIAVTIRDDPVAAMWEKFAFITAAAVLTCLVGDNIGAVARTPGGPELARTVVAEVAAVATAEGYGPAPSARSELEAFLTDPTSAFAPSMFRDMQAHRPIEVDVLAELADCARSHAIPTPLLDAVLVVIDIYHRRIGEMNHQLAPGSVLNPVDAP
jgi:2-dehydropantoate 2-reductase